MSQAIGDLFYPDNPNRRRRFEELFSQLKLYEQEFKTLETKKERVFKKARKKLDKALKEHGYETRDQLRDAIREKITDSQQLEVFDAFRDELASKGDAASVVFDLCCFVGTGATVIGASGLLASPVGWAVIGIVGAVAAGGALAIGIISFIDAMNEREKLQDGISELWRKRAVMKYYLEKMDLLVTSVETIVTNIKFGDKEELANALEESLGPAKQFGPWNTREKLQRMDQEARSWTNEDPKLYSMDWETQDYVTVEWTEDEDDGPRQRQMRLLRTDNTHGGVSWIFECDDWIYEFRSRVLRDKREQYNRARYDSDSEGKEDSENSEDGGEGEDCQSDNEDSEDDEDVGKSEDGQSDNDDESKPTQPKYDVLIWDDYEGDRPTYWHDNCQFRIVKISADF